MDTLLTRALNLKYPIIQAPCAGHTSVDLVAAVSNAGGLGSLGAAMMSCDDLRAAIRAIKSKTNQPFAVNLFCRPDRTPTQSELQAPHEPTDNVLASIRAELAIPNPTVYTLRSPPLDEQISVILDEKVPVLSFTFGVLPDNQLQRLWNAGVYLIGTATTVKEALVLAGLDPSDPTRKADAIVAQGLEAGGHRGSFLKNGQDQQLPTEQLVEQIRATFHCRNAANGTLANTNCIVNVPILAAGGLSTGTQFARALHHWHADGVVMGTLFMLASESATPAPHRKVLLESASFPPTRLTLALTGRLARGFPNAFMDRLEKACSSFPSYDIYSSKTKDIAAYCTKNGITDYMMLWSGANAPQAAEFSEYGTLSAHEIVSKLIVSLDTPV